MFQTQTGYFYKSFNIETKFLLGNDIVMNMLSNTKLGKTKIQFFTGVKHVQINFRHTDHKYFSMFSVQKVPQQTHSKVKVWVFMASEMSLLTFCFIFVIKIVSFL